MNATNYGYLYKYTEMGKKKEKENAEKEKATGTTLSARLSISQKCLLRTFPIC